MRHDRLSWVAVAAALALSACAGAPEAPKPAAVTLTIAAAPDANPGADGVPQSISVYVFQLGAAGGFESAGYFALKNEAQQTLGGDLIERKEVVLAPGVAQTLAFEAASGVKNIGVIAGYRELDKSVWRVVLPVSGDTVRTKINIEKHQLTAAPANP